MKNAILVGFVVWSVLEPITAPAATVNEYSAQALIERALERSPEVRATEFDANALRARANQVGRWDDPVLELGADKKVEPVGDTNFGRLGISQTISRPGRLKAREDAALKAAEIGSFDTENSKVELRGRVLGLIYAYRVAQEKAAHSKERFDRLKTVDTYLKGRTFAAPQRKAEAAIVRSKMLVLEKERAELEAEENTAWNTLNTYLGFEEKVAVAATWYATGKKFVLADLKKRAEEKSPEMRRQGLRVQMQESELRAARSESWPGLTLSASFANGSGATPEKNYGLGVAIPLPLLNGNRGGIEAASAAKSAEDSRLAWARLKVEASVKSAFSHYEASLASITRLSFSRNEGLERDIREIDSAFKRGQVDLITYLEADAQHVESTNAILDAQVDYVSNLRELLLLVGEAPTAQGN